ncbi:hypothetical protein [Pseudalkalibacillus hwajinpoensis]|uniref:hypothetical protein n=1 Tax=Guptibacillus hwajinpoensis TaxID=208199 RepID=UPI001CD60E1B|nr:hypothetical protein [Pseudalkalibacillus hwajinpoensis]MCA0991593.1 hypothetical protein [Pseudalkalibacillus hwajinpoensis]
MEDRFKNLEILIANLIQIVGTLRKDQSELEERYASLQSSYEQLVNDHVRKETQSSLS